MVTIFFETHATTVDNLEYRASGCADVDLSEVGIQQARDMGERYGNQRFDAIFCSTLRRSYRTAEIAFGHSTPIIRDARLNECDYGDLTQHATSEVEAQRTVRIKIPFPKGESYEQTSAKIKSFLQDLVRDYDDRTVLIVGHRATQYGLEHCINGLPLEQVVAAPWTWQPGWRYHLPHMSKFGTG